MKKTKTLKWISKVLLFVCVLAVTSFHAYADSKGSLTFKLPTDMQEDLSETTITVDLYKVANYKDGTYTNVEAFKDITWDEKDAMKNIEKVEAVLEKEKVEKDATVTVGVKAENLDLGYYYYVVQEGVSGKSYDYKFSTGLVTIPYNTETTVSLDREVDLKATREEKEGSILITKTLENWNETSKECTFVFEITGTKDGKTVYSNVAAISFNAENHGSNTVEVKGIPIGAEVTVTEVYSGGYSQTSVTPEPQIVVADQTIQFDFSNKYDEYRKTYGVENQFTWDEEWHWTPVDPKGLVTGGGE